MSMSRNDTPHNSLVALSLPGPASIEVSDVIGPPCVMAGTANPGLAEEFVS